MSSRSSPGALTGEQSTDINKSNIDYFLRRGENRSTQGKKPIGVCRVENPQTQPTCNAASGIKSEPHWWEGSVTTTTVSLHSLHNVVSLEKKFHLP